MLVNSPPKPIASPSKASSVATPTTLTSNATPPIPEKTDEELMNELAGEGQGFNPAKAGGLSLQVRRTLPACAFSERTHTSTPP